MRREEQMKESQEVQEQPTRTPQEGGEREPGQPEECVCPSCGATEARPQGEECPSMDCPRCGTPMQGSDTVQHHGD